MRYKGIAFFSMVVLSLALMALIVVTQFFTNKSTQALTQGNLQAVETFRINNSIQELVNLSFDLQSKLRNLPVIRDGKRGEQLKDSLTMLGYNANILTKATSGESADLSTRINNLIDSQVNISEIILEAWQTGNRTRKNAMEKALQQLKPGDKVYAHCLTLGELLKNNLQETLTKNSDQAEKLSTYNRVLALLAIVAILVLATIIIRRQSQQLKLIEELKMAEIAALKSKNAKDEFLANMSHELRTPLNALIGFGNLLNDTPLNERQKEYVDMIRSGGYNLLNIVNDVLDLSKIEAGKLTIVHKPFNLYSMLGRLEKLFAGAIQEKGLSYQTIIGDQVPEHVIGDLERLQQIFVNLIGNAIKFTSEGGIKVYASIVWVDEDKKYYKLGFTVKDSGAGIPKDKIETIFERFEQLEHGAQRQYGGTGLGLTIVKNLVQKMGGAISVYSQVNEGSEFNFTCILERSEAIEEETDSIANPSPSFSKHKVLVVEDNKTNQVLLKYMLGKYQIRPTITDNGLDAIHILEKDHFDLVLMDIQMPAMDGYTAIDILRNQLKKSTPIIAMTAYVSEQEIKKSREAGFSDYLPKPIDEKSLIEKISKFLNAVMPENNEGNDLSFLKELVGDDLPTLSEILHEMTLQWEKDKKDLTSASNEGDSIRIRQIVHRMKSTFSPLGPNHIVYKIVYDDSADLVNEEGPVASNCSLFIQKIDEAVSTSLKIDS